MRSIIYTENANFELNTLAIKKLKDCSTTVVEVCKYETQDEEIIGLHIEPLGWDGDTPIMLELTKERALFLAESIKGLYK